jgi:hypothetical protein
MNRIVVSVVLLVAVGSSMADETAKKPTQRPIGTWTRTLVDGYWTLEIEPNRIIFKAKGPGERISTLSVPKYEISDEGILFGYVREIISTDGDDTSNLKVVHPFAFRLKVADETLTVSDLSIRTLDASGHFAMTGEYKKEADRKTDSSAIPAKEVKR